MNLRHTIYWGFLCLGLCSCSTARFYSQALSGQVEMLRKARPVMQVLADPKTKPKLKDKLTTVAHILAFAEKELHLPAEGQYRRYTDLGRSHAVWVVFAAPEFSVEPKKWSYPLVGKLAYRGFFKEASALHEADQLKAEGYDVYVGGVDAYSTLGFLRDPLLSTFIGRDDAALAELIFHELTHQRLYLSGDTDFNEAFATSVGQEGARCWLRAQGRMKELEQYERELRVEREFISLVLKTRDELGQIYAATFGAREAKLRLKQAAFTRLRQRAESLDQRSGGTLKIERWFKKPVNNARLATLATYYDLLPGFETLIEQQGGDLERFIQEVESMRKQSHDERRNRLMRVNPSTLDSKRNRWSQAARGERP
ncbi:MAG: aminopeptidase [Prosthecobacter sp.]